MKIIRTLAIGALAASAVVASGAYAAETPSGWDADFYACAEDSFEEEFPEEPIPVTGLSDDQLSKIEQLVCPYYEDQARISNVFGLEKMTALRNISLVNTLIEEIDFSSNLALEDIILNSNSNLKSINISSNLALNAINLDDNESLTAIDVSKNKELDLLWLVNDKGVSSIDISNNSKLTSLFINGTSIQFLDISGQITANRENLDDSPIYFQANDGTIIKTGIIGEEHSGITTFDFSNLWLLDRWEDSIGGFEMDGSYSGIQYVPSIPSTNHYNYDPQTKKLYASNLDSTNNYATVFAKYIHTQSGTALDIEPTTDITEVTYRIILETSNNPSMGPGTPDTGVNTDGQDYLATVMILLPMTICVGTGIVYFVRSRKSIKLDY